MWDEFKRVSRPLKRSGTYEFCTCIAFGLAHANALARRALVLKYPPPRDQFRLQQRKRRAQRGAERDIGAFALCLGGNDRNDMRRTILKHEDRRAAGPEINGTGGDEDPFLTCQNLTDFLQRGRFGTVAGIADDADAVAGAGPVGL